MKTHGRIAKTNGISSKRIKAVSRVVGAGSVALERLETGSCITVGSRIIKGSVRTIGRVKAARGVVTKCSKSSACVGATSRVVKRLNTPFAVLLSPVVLLKRAPAPVTVLLSTVLLRRAPGANRRVEITGDVTFQ